MYYPTKLSDAEISDAFYNSPEAEEAYNKACVLSARPDETMRLLTEAASRYKAREFCVWTSARLAADFLKRV